MEKKKRNLSNKEIVKRLDSIERCLQILQKSRNLSPLGKAVINDTIDSINSGIGKLLGF